MDEVFLKYAYQDKAFPIGCDQTISQPLTVAIQTALLNVKPHEKILEVGTGSGYQTAVLLALKGQVYSIERQKELYLKLKNSCLSWVILVCFFTEMGTKVFQNGTFR